MQVPAYAPVVEGVHCDEYNGVEWSVVKTIDMLIMLWSIMLEEDLQPSILRYVEPE